MYKKLLKSVDKCRRYSEPKQCRFWDTVCSMTEKTISGVHVSSGSAEPLVRRGGITNHQLIAYSQQRLCQKLPKLVDVCWSYNVQHQCRFFETQCVLLPAFFGSTCILTKSPKSYTVQVRIKSSELRSEDFRSEDLDLNLNSKSNSSAYEFKFKSSKMDSSPSPGLKSYNCI